jgi:hypothetical protein
VFYTGLFCSVSWTLIRVCVRIVHVLETFLLFRECSNWSIVVTRQVSRIITYPRRCHQSLLTVNSGKNGYLCTCLLGKCCLVTGHRRPLGDAANCNLRTKSLTLLIQEPLIYIIVPFSERLYTSARYW